MPRLARIVLPGLAHHVTQRGNGRQQVFFSDADYALYLHLLREACLPARVTCLAFCLMPNHAHLILVPAAHDGLRRCLAAVHRAYAGSLNMRRQVTGHFWQGRYASVAMDDAHLYEAVRYVLLNPVRAGLVRTAAAWRWSSARAYLTGLEDGVTDPRRMRRMIPDVATYLGEEPDAACVHRLRAGQAVGRPALTDDALARLEQETGRQLRPLKCGRKRLPTSRGRRSRGARPAPE